ncbi:hypothetical protein CRENBAI_005938 [Crenichthys baileyi]|uniref:Uncharacterized protein n=1 Tax=Crenichthys baileyi TaxID=28760 RepID=A0AAV9QVQ6_9TELE
MLSSTTSPRTTSPQHGSYTCLLVPKPSFHSVSLKWELVPYSTSVADETRLDGELPKVLNQENCLNPHNSSSVEGGAAVSFS